MTIREKPLKLSSYNELRTHASLTAENKREIDRIDFLKTLDKVIAIEKRAKQMLEEGNCEEAYMLYKRGSDICDLMLKKADYPKVQKTPVMELSKVLKKRYDEKEIMELANVVHQIDVQLPSQNELQSSSPLAAPQTSSYSSVPPGSSTHQQQQSTPRDRIPSAGRPLPSFEQKTVNRHGSINDEQPRSPSSTAGGEGATPTTHISARDFVRHVEKNKYAALIIDYREEKPHLIDYSHPAHLIQVCVLDPKLLRPGAILSMLLSMLDISERPLLQRLSIYEMVVLVTDEQEAKKTLDQLPKSSKTKVLIEALTTYNTSRDKLRRPPLIMELGFRGWDLAYPCYTKSTNGSQSKFEEPFDLESQFGDLLSAAMKANALDIVYPNLYKTASNEAANAVAAAKQVHFAPSPPRDTSQRRASYAEKELARDAGRLPPRMPPQDPLDARSREANEAQPRRNTRFPRSSSTEAFPKAESATRVPPSPPRPGARDTDYHSRYERPSAAFPSDSTSTSTSSNISKYREASSDWGLSSSGDRLASLSGDSSSVRSSPTVLGGARIAATSASAAGGTATGGVVTPTAPAAAEHGVSSRPLLPARQPTTGAPSAGGSTIAGTHGTVGHPLQHHSLTSLEPSPAAAVAPARPPTPDRTTKKPGMTSAVVAAYGQHPAAGATAPPPSSPAVQSQFSTVYAVSLQYIDKAAKHGRTTLGHTGLFNMGNTCFMNATLQALFHTPEFAPLFSQLRVEKHINPTNKFGTRGVISGTFAALVDAAWSGRYSAIRPEFFLSTFASRVNHALADRRQHDAQEFQIYLLDALHEDCNTVSARQPFEQNYNGAQLARDAEDYVRRSRLFSSSVVNDIFNLRTVSRLQCTVCNTASVTFEGMTQLSVELPSINTTSSFTLNDCLQQHFAEVLLDGSSCWKCPTCKKPQVAGRSTRIWTLPPVLVVHLKRFSLERGEFVKNEVEVGFDIGNLNLAPFVHEQAPKQLPSNYHLYAVTNHDGRLNSGHYTSVIRNLVTQEWMKFDDDQSSRIHPSSIMSKRAFILYYANIASPPANMGNVHVNGGGGTSAYGDNLFTSTTSHHHYPSLSTHIK